MTDMFSDTVLDKARGYFKGGKVTAISASDGPRVFEVQGTAARPYRVQTDADIAANRMTWATCTCKHGAHSGGVVSQIRRCSHVAAALMWIRYQSIDNGHDIPEDGATNQPEDAMTTLDLSETYIGLGTSVTLEDGQTYTVTARHLQGQIEIADHSTGRRVYRRVPVSEIVAIDDDRVRVNDTYDYASSASRQHFIETGEYLKVGEAL